MIADDYPERVAALQREGLKARFFAESPVDFWGIEGSGLVGTHNKTEEAAWREVIEFRKRIAAHG